MDALDTRISLFRNYYRQAVNSPVIRNLANRITYGAKTDMEKVERIADWVRNNIRYQREPPKLDIAVPPVRAIEIKRIDCEDYAMLISSLAGAVGIPSKWKVISQNGRIWSHIYPLLRVNGAYKPVDLTVPLPLFGEVRNYIQSRVYNVQGNEIPDNPLKVMLGSLLGWTILHKFLK